MKPKTNCVAATFFAAMVVGCGDAPRQADAPQAVDPARSATPTTATTAAKPVAPTVVLSVPGMT
jgi:hypothetical protein